MPCKAKMVFLSMLVFAALSAAYSADRTRAATIDVPCNTTALIQAIETANNETTNPGPDTLELAAGCTYTLTTQYGDVNRGLPLITSDITINGNGAAITRDAAAPQFGLFQVQPGSLTLNQVTLSGGHARDGTPFAPPGIYGGAIVIRFASSLTVVNSTISGNAAGSGYSSATSDGGNGGDGGAIFAQSNSGSVSIVNSTIIGNSAGNGGNGAPNKFTGNGGSGGAIYVLDTNVSITNSTIAGNSAGNGGTSPGSGAGGTGGGIYNPDGIVTLTNSTISGNGAGLSGVGIPAFGGGYSGGALSKNTLIAKNLTGGDCSAGAGFDPQSTNNIASDASCSPGFTQKTSAEINLQPLANNGGPTQTMGLGPLSAALDAGDDAICAAAPVGNQDQRGVSRTFDGDADGTAHCDIGAYECGVSDDCNSLIVDTTSDANLTACTSAAADCSLRGAINTSNSSPGRQYIEFNIPPAGTKTITVATDLPNVTGEATIDGSTQPGYAGGPIIVIDGNSGFLTGLVVTGGSTSVRGLTFYRFQNAGIVLNSAGNTITNSYIIVNGEGIFVQSGSNNTIGGTNGTTPGGFCTGDCNLISGNSSGIRVSSTNTVIQGNFIGTNIPGNADLGNFTHGIRFDTLDVDGSLVGGAVAAARNVISGNDGDGISFGPSFAGETAVTIQGNYIGTNSAGDADLGNTQRGILVGNFASNNTIGGSGPGEGNLISGNNGGGVALTGTGNIMRGNLVGTAADGITALGNTGAGVRVVQASTINNTIGGVDLGQGNVIAFNSGDGVRVETGTGNTIRGNSIYSNGLLGLENITGGNGEPGHEPPVIASVGSAAGTACANCIIDVYSDSGDEGRLWQGSVVADGAGNWKYFGPVTGPNITATATNSSGSTSEFSAAFTCGNSDPDGLNDCVDGDDDNDGYSDEAESGIPLCRNTVNDDAFDGETLFFVNDGCPAIGVPEVNCGGALDNDLDGFPNDGCPKDGASSEAQFKIGTGSQDPCGNEGWPNDLSSAGLSFYRLDLLDLSSFIANPRKLNTSPGEAGFGSRWDVIPGGLSGDFINLQDMAAMVPGALTSTSRPPMFGGQPGWLQTCPYPP